MLELQRIHMIYVTIKVMQIPKECNKWNGFRMLDLNVSILTLQAMFALSIWNLLQVHLNIGCNLHQGGYTFPDTTNKIRVCNFDFYTPFYIQKKITLFY